MSHYRSPTATAVNERYRSSREPRGVGAPRVYDQVPMTRASRKKSEEDSHVTKRLKR